jgi:excisionase family DNA binding protein
MDLEFLTPKEVAPILRVSKQHISSLIRRKELPAVKVGRCVRIRRADLEAWIQAQTEGRHE